MSSNEVFKKAKAEMANMRTATNLSCLAAGIFLLMALLIPIRPDETTIMGRVVGPVIFMTLAMLFANIGLNPSVFDVTGGKAEEPAAPPSIETPGTKPIPPSPTEVTKADYSALKKKLVSLVNQRDAELEQIQTSGKPDELIDEEAAEINERYSKLMIEA